MNSIHNGSIVIVRCEGRLANSQLNNSYGRLVSQGGFMDIHHVLLISGPDAGRMWQFGREQIRLANKRGEK